MMDGPETNHLQGVVVVCDFCNQRLDQIDQIHVLLEQSAAFIEILEAAVATNSVSTSAIASTLTIAKGHIRKSADLAKGQGKDMKYLIAI